LPTRSEFLKTRRAHAARRRRKEQMEGGVLVTNWNTRDIGSLEEVFRSHEFGRATNAMGGRKVSGAAGREDALFAHEFGL